MQVLKTLIAFVQLQADSRVQVHLTFFEDPEIMLSAFCYLYTIDVAGTNNQLDFLRMPLLFTAVIASLFFSAVPPGFPPRPTP